LYTCSIWYCHCLREFVVAHVLYVNYQLDALIIIYSQNIIFLYMFRALSAHLQEDTVVYMQHMELSQFVVACRCTAHAVYRQATKNSHRE